jgi:uncharacterized protein HemX
MDSTLETLTKRVESLEQQVGKLKGSGAKDWRRAVGMFADSEFIQQVIAEGRAIRDADRQAAREGKPE